MDDTDSTAGALVVGVVPGQPETVVRTAAEWARALGGLVLYCAYVDPRRIVVREHPDGTVDHVDVDPDVSDDVWQERQTRLVADLNAALRSTGRAKTDSDAGAVPWRFRYLAGSRERALTHLARAVSARAIVVGTRRPGTAAGIREFVDGSVAMQLTHHQHRPVIVVPTSVVDWKEPLL